jgi:hypothetical protein
VPGTFSKVPTTFSAPRCQALFPRCQPLSVPQGARHLFPRCQPLSKSTRHSSAARATFAPRGRQRPRDRRAPHFRLRRLRNCARLARRALDHPHETQTTRSPRPRRTPARSHLGLPPRLPQGRRLVARHPRPLRHRATRCPHLTYRDNVSGASFTCFSHTSCDAPSDTHRSRICFANAGWCVATTANPSTKQVPGNDWYAATAPM